MIVEFLFVGLSIITIKKCDIFAIDFLFFIAMLCYLSIMFLAGCSRSVPGI